MAALAARYRREGFCPDYLTCAVTETVTGSRTVGSLRITVPPRDRRSRV